MRATTSTALLAALMGSASAHMMLSYPPPLNSKFNPFAESSNIDYSYTAPLAADGSDYPCKGYQKYLGTPAGQPTASFEIGGQGNITVVGGAAHGGGSCQISLSTDGAKTFTVIQSIVGNCPTNGEGNFDFTVPSDVPAGNAVLAWSWNNRIGNREFYMNCAAVSLTGGSAKREPTDKRGVAFSSRPQIFVANIGNGCSVAEGGDVEYPNPGPEVKQQSDNPEAPSGNCGPSALSSGPGSSDSGSTHPPNPSPVAETTPISPLAGAVFATVSVSPEVPVASQPSTTLATVTSSTPNSTPDTSSHSPARPFSTGGSSAGAGAVAGATTPGSACATEGEWNCVGGSSFQRCASGRWTVVLKLAPGTSCKSGVDANLRMVYTRDRKRAGRFHPRHFAA